MRQKRVVLNVVLGYTENTNRERRTPMEYKKILLDVDDLIFMGDDWSCSER